MTPAITTAIPVYVTIVIVSCPRAAAPTAETAGIRAENMLDFIIPSFAMEATQHRNATQEHKTANDKRGTITLALKKVLLRPSIPKPKNNGRNNNAPIRN